MAGDWLKIEVALPDKPEVWRMAGALGVSAEDVVGRLIRVWAWFDTHTENGHALGVTYPLLDRVAGVTGFAEAMALVGWLTERGSELSLPNFDRHNGKTAKNRALANDRKKASRENVTLEGADMSRSDRDKSVPREEKRREEKNREVNSPVDADAPTPPPAGPPDDRHPHKLSASGQTDEAIATFNASGLVKPLGLLPAVSTKVGREKRIAEVRRVLKLAIDICADVYQFRGIHPDFWADYWKICHADDFASGRAGGGRDHPNWVPDFEFLTRPKTMLKLFEKARGG